MDEPLIPNHAGPPPRIKIRRSGTHRCDTMQQDTCLSTSLLEGAACGVSLVQVCAWASWYSSEMSYVNDIAVLEAATSKDAFATLNPADCLAKINDLKELVKEAFL